MYFCGGRWAQHLEILNNIPNLRVLLKDKVISWNSAGSVIWSKYFYTEYTSDVLVWLWYLNNKMMIHWLSEKYPWVFVEKNLEKLKNYWEDLPIYKIKEQEYEVFEI